MDLYYSEKPIFVGGTGRSGTTLMTRLLDLHHELSSFGEVKVHLNALSELQGIYKQEKQQRDALLNQFREKWTGEYFRFVVPWETKDGSEGVRGLTCWYTMDEIDACLPVLQQLDEAENLQAALKIFGSFLCVLFDIQAEKSKRKYWAEKTPGNSLAAPLLMQCIPGIRMINMIRDGRDVACSLGKVGWGIKDPFKALDWWAQNLVQALRGQKMMPKGTVLNVRYEDVIGQCEGIMRKVVHFLELDWDENILTQPLSSKPVNRYKEELSVEVKQYAVTQYGNLLKSLGYPTDASTIHD